MLGQYSTAFAAASPAVSSFVHIPGTPENFHAGEMTGAEVTGVLVTGAAVTGAEEATGALVVVNNLRRRLVVAATAPAGKT